MAQQLKVFRTLDFMEATTGTKKIRFDSITTADVLYLLANASNTDYIAIGNGTLLTDFKLFGATSAKHVLWDASADTLEFIGTTGISMSTTSKFVLPYKASGSSTNGDIWVDTTVYTLNFYANGTEYKVTATAI